MVVRGETEQLFTGETVDSGAWYTVRTRFKPRAEDLAIEVKVYWYFEYTTLLGLVRDVLAALVGPRRPIKVVGKMRGVTVAVPERHIPGQARPTRGEAKEVLKRLTEELAQMSLDDVEGFFSTPDTETHVAQSGNPMTRQRVVEVRGPRTGARYLANYAGAQVQGEPLRGIVIVMEIPEGWGWRRYAFRFPPVVHHVLLRPGASSLGSATDDKGHEPPGPKG
jgi:hypothetical protein